MVHTYCDPCEGYQLLLVHFSTAVSTGDCSAFQADFHITSNTPSNLCPISFSGYRRLAVMWFLSSLHRVLHSCGWKCGLSYCTFKYFICHAWILVHVLVYSDSWKRTLMLAINTYWLILTLQLIWFVLSILHFISILSLYHDWPWPCVWPDNSGCWGHGGIFRALDSCSPLPQLGYSFAGRMSGIWSRYQAIAHPAVLYFYIWSVKMPHTSSHSS